MTWTEVPSFDEDHVDFETVVPFKERLLRRAWSNFTGPAGDRFRDDFSQFVDTESWWLADYSLFMAIKQDNEMAGWHTWPRDLRLRDSAALEAARADLADEIAFIQFVQWCFQRQWMELRRYANERGIRVVGDIPIFVAEDSADVWGSQNQFQLDAEGRAQVVAGVPPRSLFGYRSDLGQPPV
jgi:4-alpha-glucanotransferase